jgi:hypothetical protein
MPHIFAFHFSLVLQSSFVLVLQHVSGYVNNIKFLLQTVKRCMGVPDRFICCWTADQQYPASSHSSWANAPYRGPKSRSRLRASPSNKFFYWLTLLVGKSGLSCCAAPALSSLLPRPSRRCRTGGCLVARESPKTAVGGFDTLVLLVSWLRAQRPNIQQRYETGRSALGLIKEGRRTALGVSRLLGVA